MIDNGFVYAVNIHSEKQKKKQKMYDKNMSKLYDILKRKNITLVDSSKEDFNKSELSIIKKVGLLHYLT